MNKQPPKQNKISIVKDISLLLAVPLAIILIVGAFVYIPRLLAHPKYNFLYSTCQDYDCVGSYVVDGSRIMTTGTSEDYRADFPQPSLRYYDVASGSSHAISMSSAKSLQLDNSSRSPDGYTLKQDSSDSGLLFWSSSDNNWYLKDGAMQKSVNLPTDSTPVKFIGWIEQ